MNLQKTTSYNLECREYKTVSTLFVSLNRSVIQIYSMVNLVHHKY
jgi:hypothetical protein